jgi:putative DNA primase/helicase
VRDVLERFPDARKSGKEWAAKCPAHDDHRASLNIGKGDNGGWVLHCHAGCDYRAVLAAVGLVEADLFPKKTTVKAEIVAVYQYRDEGDVHLFDVVRYEPKDFRQRREDGTWNMSGVRRVLYRLPDLQGHRTAYLPEGEKDVDELRRRGLTATTCPGGAGKWRDEYTQQLKAAGVERVIILPDNDDPGRRHAADVAQRCHAAGIQVQVVSLPDLPLKGDVSDWLSVPGRGTEDLHRIVKATAVYEPAMTADLADRGSSRAPTARQPIVTFLSTVTPEPVDWIWPGRLARRRYTLLSGEPGLGKSFVSLDVAARISRGLAFPDGTPAPLGRVLLLVAEDGLSDTVRPRLDALGGDPSRVAVLEAIREPDGTRAPVSLVDHMPALRAAVAEVNPDLLIIDPITAFLGRTDSHRDVEVRATLAPLLDLCEQKNFALLTIGHLSKDSQRAALHRPGGSIAFVAAARIVLALAADPNDPDRRLLAPLKANICRPSATLAYRVTDDKLAWETAAVTDIDVEALFRPSNPTGREERTDAEEVIRDLMEIEVWPLEAKRAMDAGQAHGVPERTMRYTAKRLGIRISRLGFGGSGKWMWHKPETAGIPATVAATSPKAVDVAGMAPLPECSGNSLNNNIEASRSAFARARERVRL